MKLIRTRAQEQFPSVLLTLLSIVQAIALGLLWSHLQEAEHLRQLNATSIVAGTQVFATLFCIVLVWITYASNVMRFRWIPTTADSVYPFVIGLLEFLQIETLGPDMTGQWSILMAIIFGSMVFVAQTTMRRARLSGENGDFFDGITPAKLIDFLPQISIVILLLAGGTYVWINGQNNLHSILLITSILGLLIWQHISATIFWNTSMNDDSEPENSKINISSG